MRAPIRAAIGTALFSIALIALVGTAFYAGYVTAGVGAPIPVLGTLPMPPGIAPSRLRDANVDELRDRLGVVLEAWRIVNDEFYDPAALDATRMSYGAIKGFLDTLGDRNTSLADPQRARQQQEDIRGSFDGVGISVELRDGRPVVTRVLDNSPASAAGLRVGDLIVRVDGEDVRAPSLDQIVPRIRGPRGSRVVLTVVRVGEPEPLVFDLVRGEVKTSPLTRQTLPGNIVYVRVPSFTGAAGRDLAEELRRGLEARPVGVVIDLRNNPGGLLNSAVDVASQFLTDGVVLYEQRRGRDPKPFHVRRGGVATDLPLVVLVNRGSASAAEIVAGALQDRQRAVLIGEPTFGKDSVQNVHRLSDRSSLRVTSARWYTPLKQPIAGKGLTPDVVVTQSDDDRRAGRDPQLDAAADYLRTRLARAD